MYCNAMQCNACMYVCNYILYTYMAQCLVVLPSSPKWWDGCMCIYRITRFRKYVWIYVYISFMYICIYRVSIHKYVMYIYIYMCVYMHAVCLCAIYIYIQYVYVYVICICHMYIFMYPPRIPYWVGGAINTRHGIMMCIYIY